MKQRLTSSRSTDTSILLPYRFDPTFTLFLLATIVAFVTAASHSKEDVGHTLDLSLDHHKDVVDIFKSKVLKHMGLREAPSPAKALNVSGNSMHGKLIRNYLRNQINGSHEEGEGEEEPEVHYVDELQTLKFPSTDRRIKVPVQPTAATSWETPDVSSLTFSTRFQQPDVPYYDLVVRSAILRLHIRRQKSRLQQKANLPLSPLNVSVYLLRSSDREGKKRPQAMLLHSETVNPSKFKRLKINIKSHLLSEYVDNEESDVTFGVRVEDASDDSVVEILDSVSNDSQSQELSIPRDKRSPRQLVKITRAKLQVGVQTRDLRRTRSKRQTTNSSCSPGLCCKQSLYVNFKDIGWSGFVLYPEGYTAYICQGSCPYRYKTASHFTSVKIKLHELYPARVPEPTCAPAGYTSISLLVFDGAVATEQEYQEMVVTDCKCY